MIGGPVLTYGDLMLDVRVTGGCGRMSPEAAQAPVMRLDSVEAMAGGAANVAANVASMGGHSLLVGTVGRDPCAAILAAALVGAGVDSEMLARDAPTTSKVRFIDEGRQILRLDIERIAPLDGGEEDQMIARLMDRLPKVSVAVISDYAKGAVTPKVAAKLIVAASVLGVPVVVDTKSPAAPHWRGAAVVKPNLIEIAAALGVPEPQSDGEAAVAAESLRRRCGAAFVVLTRGARGICLSGDPGRMHFAGHAVAAVDVTGAGDAVAAALALALAGGESIVDAVRFANAAGAAAVTKMGTAALTFEEINFFYDCDGRGAYRAGGGMAGERPSHRLH